MFFTSHSENGQWGIKFVTFRNFAAFWQNIDGGRILIFRSTTERKPWTFFFVWYINATLKALQTHDIWNVMRGLTMRKTEMRSLGIWSFDEKYSGMRVNYCLKEHVTSSWQCTFKSDCALIISCHILVTVFRLKRKNGPPRGLYKWTSDTLSPFEVTVSLCNACREIVRKISWHIWSFSILVFISSRNLTRVE